MRTKGIFPEVRSKGLLCKVWHLLTGPIPEFLIRYIDDMLGITTMSIPHCETYIRGFNLFHPAIKLTHEISPISGVFLDLSLTVKGNAVSTSVHYKPTDSHSYLRYDSHHPDKCRDSIPYSQFLRLRHICSEDEDFAQKTDEKKDFWKIPSWRLN